MQKIAGSLVAILIVMFLIAPTQTKSLITDLMGLVSHRVSQVDTTTSGGSH